MAHLGIQREKGKDPQVDEMPKYRDYVSHQTLI